MTFLSLVDHVTSAARKYNNCDQHLPLKFTNTNEIEMCKRYFVTTTPCFSHYNFQRFCRVVQAHYMYLRKLPEFEIQSFSSYKVKNGKGEKWVL